MDWIRKNKFTAGFLAFVVVGAGALIYLLVSQMADYDKVAQDYDTTVKEVQRLEALEPYPDQAGQRKLEDQRKSTAAAVTDLQTYLAAYEPPTDKTDIRPIDFQDKLRRVVDEVTQAAKVANVDLPKDFYMGFETYRVSPPEPVAAPALSRELDAIQDLMMILINKRIAALTSIKRAPLPQEPGGNNPAPGTAAPRPGGKPGTAADSVTRQTVTLAFKGQPSAYRDALDQLVTSKRLFLVRAVQVKNDMEAGPKKVPAAAVPDVQPANPPAPGTPPDPNAAPAPVEKPNLRYIVGVEGVTVVMRIEIVRVAPAST